MGGGASGDNIFSNAFISEIGSILGIRGQAERIELLRGELETLGGKWRSVIRKSTFDFPAAPFTVHPSKRIRWLENNIEKPAKDLSSHLGEKFSPYFSDWGCLNQDLGSFDREAVRGELEKLLEHVETLISELTELKNIKAPQTGDIRYEIVWDLVQVFKAHCPEHRLSAGTYDPESSKWIGHLPEFVAAAFSEITGGRPLPGKKLDNLLRLALKD